MRSKRSRTSASAPFPDDELDFVDSDFLPLAAQLGAEANSLATLYPPNDAVLEQCQQASLTSERRHATRWRVFRRVATLLTTSAVVVLAVSLAVRMSLGPNESIQRTTPAVWQEVQPLVTSPAVLDPADLGSEYTPEIAPVMFVSELSDPELDAWLDLRRNRTKERIAF